MELRQQCAAALLQRNTRGFAVGGLSGGESKDEFWRTVDVCTGLLPVTKPRYLMGVGFAADLVVCVALGIDMFDCVFPTRTARFGCALVRSGQLNLKQAKYALDRRPVAEDCGCTTCQHYTRSYLHHIVTAEPVACSLLSIHNVYFQVRPLNKILRFLSSFLLISKAHKDYKTILATIHYCKFKYQDIGVVQY